MNIKKVFLYINEDNGVGWYRQIQPLRQLAKLKLVEVKVTEFTGVLKATQFGAKDCEEFVKWADIIYVTVPKTQEQTALYLAMKKWGKCKLVMDIDDNILSMSEDHPNYHWYTNMDTSPAEWVLQGLKEADLMVTTNQHLADIFSPYCRNSYIMPNSIDFEAWNYKKRGKNKKITIGWAGASGHQNDLLLVKKAVDKLKGKVKFVCMGDYQNNRWFNYDRNIPWSTIEKYPKTYAQGNFDIVIAPMRDNRYNRGKSCLRIIEAGSLKIPVVASPVGDYQGFPVLYAKDRNEWTTQLERLVDDEKLRVELGEKLYQKVYNEYNLLSTAKKLYKKLEKYGR